MIRLSLLGVLLGVFDSASASAMPPQREGVAEPIYFRAEPTWIVLAGATGGGALGGRADGPFVGLEASVVRLHRGVWVGGYVDAFYDFPAAAPTMTLGPEVGFWFVGVDGGLAARAIDGDAALGAAGRLAFTAGVVAVFGRYIYWPEDVGAEHVLQVGFTFKVPAWSDR